jgi:hypothetical protein
MVQTRGTIPIPAKSSMPRLKNSRVKNPLSITIITTTTTINKVLTLPNRPGQRTKNVQLLPILTSNSRKLFA